MPGVVEGISSLSLEEQNSQVMSLEEAQNVVLKWEPIESMVWESSTEESRAYLMAVDILQQSRMAGLRCILNLAVKRLNNEFKHLLALHSECVDQTWLPESFSAPSFSSTTEDDDSSSEQQQIQFQQQQSLSLQRERESFIIDLLPFAIVTDLGDIARRMLLLGRSDDCVEAYLLIRKGVLEGSMFNLGVERVTCEEIHRMQWDILQPRLKRWTKGMKATVRVLFASERSLCNEVFIDDVDTSDTCFGLLANDVALQMLKVFEDVAGAPESPDRLFPLLDVYEALRDSMQVIQETFQGEPCSDIPRYAASVLCQLSDAVKGTFVTLKNAIETNSSRSPAPGGALHPLTRFVMNSLGLLSEYLRPLKEIYGVEDDDTGGGDTFAEPDHGGDEVQEPSALQAEVMLVLEALLQNLEEHSKLYKESALGRVFLMNNTHYIVQKLKALELQAVVKDGWVRKHSSAVRSHAISYQREAWGKIFLFLRDEGIRTDYSNVSRDVLKERFKSFNAAIEEIHKTQSHWVISDPGLRNELRVLIGDKLLMAYRSFLGRYRVHMETIRHHERYLKYSDDDLENMLNDLFEGTSGSMGRRRSLSGSG